MKFHVLGYRLIYYGTYSIVACATTTSVVGEYFCSLYALSCEQFCFKTPAQEI